MVVAGLARGDVGRALRVERVEPATVLGVAQRAGEARERAGRDGR